MPDKNEEITATITNSKGESADLNDKEAAEKVIGNGLNLTSDCKTVHSNEAFALGRERESIKHFPKRLREIEKKLKKMYPDQNVIIREEPDGKEGESNIYYTSFWEDSVVPAVKSQPPKPKTNKKVWCFAAGMDTDSK